MGGERRAEAAIAPLGSYRALPDRVVVQNVANVAGTIKVGGAKNDFPKLVIAALLSDSLVEIANIPAIRERGVLDLLSTACGFRLTVHADRGSVSVDPTGLTSPDADELAAIMRQSRIPVLITAPILARCGHITLARSGGCDLGNRPTDFHMMVLQAMGAAAEDLDENRVTLRLEGGFRGAALRLPYPSVGATEQFLLAAATADGESQLENAAIEPEVMNLVALLQRMGVNITKLPHRTFRVLGTRGRRLQGAFVESIPDRVEVASWASLALAAGGELTVHGAVQQDLSAFLYKYREAGGEFEFGRDGTVTFSCSADPARSLHLETDVHPGFSTDWQPLLVAARIASPVFSIVHETVYEERLGFIGQLRKLGVVADVLTDCLGSERCRFGRRNYRHSAVLHGTPGLIGDAHLTVPDLRAGFAVLIAAAVAPGATTITGFGELDRGYSNLLTKLNRVGVKVEIPGPS